MVDQVTNGNAMALCNDVDGVAIADGRDTLLNSGS
tara:strand:+ start:305 stop:409 length:105 start_codon:yes stop_codon:yes gene_type:complete